MTTSEEFWSRTRGGKPYRGPGPSDQDIIRKVIREELDERLLVDTPQYAKMLKERNRLQEVVARALVWVKNSKDDTENIRGLIAILEHEE